MGHPVWHCAVRDHSITSGSNKGEIFARESNQAVEAVLLVQIWKVGQPGHQEPAGNTRTILLSSSASYRHTPLHSTSHSGNNGRCFPTDAKTACSAIWSQSGSIERILFFRRPVNVVPERRGTDCLTHPPRRRIIQGPLVSVHLRARTDAIFPHTSVPQLCHPNPEPVLSLSASLAYG